MRGVIVLVPPTARREIQPLTDYKAPNYWLDYRGGFVRRGLPGAVLRGIVGRPPSYRQVESAALALSRTAAMVIVPVALRVAGRAPGPLGRVVSAALVVLSPLTCSLVLHDLGRYDGVGVLVLALLASARPVWLRLPVPLGVALVGAAVAVAVASEEFLLAVVAPTAATAVAALTGARNLSPVHRAQALGFALAPGVVVAGASLLPAPPAALLAAREQAARAGVRPDEQMGDALDALDRGLVENLSFFRLFEPAALLCWAVVWSGLYGVSASVLGRLTGVGADRAYRRTVGAHAVVGAVLSGLGTDFRRWWGLAFLGLVSTVALLDPTPAEPVGAATLAGGVALALTGLWLRETTVYPPGTLRTTAPPRT